MMLVLSVVFGLCRYSEWVGFWPVDGQAVAADRDSGRAFHEL